MYNFPFAVQGNPVDGQIVAFDASTKQGKWIDPPSSGTVTPLSTVLFVDPGTQSTEQDGSVANPFANLQDAVDAASDNFTIIICPSDGEAVGGATWEDKNLTFFGLALGTTVGSINNQANIGALASTGLVRVFLQNVRVNGTVNVTSGEGCTIVARDSVLGGNVTADLTRINNCHIGGNIVAGSGSVVLDSTFDTGVEITGNIEIDATSYFRAVNGIVVFNTTPTLIEGSDGITNQSSVTGGGVTVTNALDALQGQIT